MLLDNFLSQQNARSFYRWVLLVCGFLAAIEAMDVYIVGVIIAPMSKAFGVSLAAFGLLFTFQAVGQIIGSYLVAPIADRAGRRPVILTCTLGFGLLTLTSAYSPNLPTFIGQRLVSFIFVGGAVSNIFAMASELVPGKLRHRNALIIGSFHGIGAGMAALAGGWLLDLGWQAPLLACGGLTLCSVVLAYFFMPESIRFLQADPAREERLTQLVRRIDPSVQAADFAAPDAPEQTTRPQIANLFRQGRWQGTMLLWLIGATTISMIGTVAQWAPTYFHVYGDVSVKQAAFMTSLNGPAGVIWPIILIWIISRIGLPRAMAFNYALAAGALASFAFVPAFPQFGWVVAAGFGAFLGGATSGFYALCNSAYPTAIRATGLSWAVGAGRVFSLVVPALGGLAIALKVSATSIAIAIAAPLIMVIVATLLLGTLLERREENAA